MALSDVLAKLFAQVDEDREKLIVVKFDQSRVTPRKFNSQLLTSGTHYVRLWLSEMFLRKHVQWFTTLYPAVHSLVGFQFGSQRVNIPNIADSSRIGTQQSQRGDVIARNFVLTPTTPFSGGTIDVSAGLVAVQGQNNLNKFISVLGSFANLMAVPQLSAVLSVARPLADGMEQLFGAGNGHLHLGWRETFAGGGVQECYIAVIRASQRELTQERLWVVDDELRQGKSLDPGQHTPFEDNDYMLFRIELFTDRDDWDKLTSIDTPYQEALTAAGEGDEAKATFFLRRALRAAQGADELTEVDRRRVVDKIKERYQQRKAELQVSGAVGGLPQPLGEAMRTAISVEEAIQRGAPTDAEVLGLSWLN
ncbi:MAG: hypothetical protein JO121_25500 [Deltaproteobacteria bacterium]|nr:hypothetical protein [Deltaproteobacteria bacterium]